MNIPKSAQVLQLNTGALLRREQGRAVFAVNGAGDLVAKVPIGADVSARKRRVRPLVHTQFPVTLHRALVREVSHEMEVRMRSFGTAFVSPLATTHGMTRTDMGLGLLMQRVGPKAGGLGLTLDEFIARDMLDTAALKALNDFARSVFALGVVVPKADCRSIVWGQEDGICRPFIVDGFGDPSVIRLRAWFPFLRRYELHRGMERMAGEIGLHWSRRKKMFLRSRPGAHL
tara:strand:- start:851 stop:1540 length:690 start_codon:yes stop_codon:yes gene_type:complete